MQRHYLTDITLRNISDQAKDKLEDLQNHSVELSTKALKSVDAYVHKKPWIVMGVLSFVSMLVGFLFGRRGQQMKVKKKGR